MYLVTHLGERVLIESRGYGGDFHHSREIALEGMATVVASRINRWGEAVVLGETGGVLPSVTLYVDGGGAGLTNYLDDQRAVDLGADRDARFDLGGGATGCTVGARRVVVEAAAGDPPTPTAFSFMPVASPFVPRTGFT